MKQGDTIQIKYPALFSVNVLHHYFLDSKALAYDEMTADEKLKMLAGYDSRAFFSIRPTISTEKLMAGNGLLYRAHGHGFTVLTKRLPASGGGFDPPTKLSDDTVLRFLIRVNAPLFYQYSSPFLKKEPVRIEKAAVLGDPDKVFFKTYLLTNEVGNLAGAMPPVLSKPPTAAEAVAAPYPVESIMSVGGVVKQAKLRSPNLAAANWQTVFNSRFITDADLVELEASSELPTDIFGVIEISASSTITDAAYRLYNADDSLASPKFEIRIKNRSTWWRYHGLPALPVEYRPLTAKTVVQVDGKDVPNPDARNTIGRQLEPDNININRLFSDIYL